MLLFGECVSILIFVECALVYLSGEGTSALVLLYGELIFFFKLIERSGNFLTFERSGNF